MSTSPVHFRRQAILFLLTGIFLMVSAESANASLNGAVRDPTRVN